MPNRDCRMSTYDTGDFLCSLGYRTAWGTVSPVRAVTMPSWRVGSHVFASAPLQQQGEVRDARSVLSRFNTAINQPPDCSQKWIADQPSVFRIQYGSKCRFFDCFDVNDWAY